VILAVQGAGLDGVQEEGALEVGPLAERGVENDRPRREPIKGDELLDVHLLLRDFSGRLTELVQQPSGDRR
jgi:hypothetical protein